MYSQYICVLSGSLFREGDLHMWSLILFCELLFSDERLGEAFNFLKYLGAFKKHLTYKPN